MTKKVTFRSTYTARACEEMGPVHLTYVDTVHEDGLIEWSVKGTSDGEYVNKCGTRRAEMSAPLDLDKITAARRAQGWEVLS